MPHLILHFGVRQADLLSKPDENRTHFAFRVDIWTDDGENIIEHVAGVEDFRSRRRLTTLPASAGPKRH